MSVLMIKGNTETNVAEELVEEYKENGYEVVEKKEVKSTSKTTARK